MLIFSYWRHSQSVIAESDIVNVLRKMVDKAWQWAKNSKNHRVNKFRKPSTQQRRMKNRLTEKAAGRPAMEHLNLILLAYIPYPNPPQNGSFPSCCQDESGSLLDSDLPDTTGKPESWQASSGETSNPEHAVGK